MNRVLDALDIVTRPWATIGDILLDTGTSPNAADGKIALEIENMSAVFPNARFGFNIWIDGSIGTFYRVRIKNSTVSDEVYWEGISDLNNFVHIKPVPGTQVVVEKNAWSSNSFLFEVRNFKHIVIDGESDAFPGLRDGWPGIFLTNHFGFKFTNGIYPEDGHTLVIGAPPDGLVVVRGTEHQGGFTGIRFGDSYQYGAIRILIERVYIHDAGSGEGAYLGSTHDVPAMMLIVEIRDVVVANRACEGLQLQHVISGGGEIKYVENFVNYCPAMDGVHAFLGGQDTGIQDSIAEGGAVMRYGITDGSAFSALGIGQFGSLEALGQTVNPLIPREIKHMLFHNIGGALSYLHNSNSDGNWRVLSDIYCVNFSNRYYYNNCNNLDDYYVSANYGTNKFSFVDCYHDGVKSAFFQAPSDVESINITLQPSMPSPVYMNVGHPEPSRDFMNWKATYANYFDEPTLDRPVTYLEGWIVVNIEQGVEYAYYRVMSTHTTTGVGALNPRQDILANGEVRYKKITWDTSGRRNLLANGQIDPAWNSASVQSLIPPHDLRLVADNYWNKKGFGLLSNPHNTDYTQIGWFRSNTGTEADMIEIPSKKIDEYTVQEADFHKYIAMGIKYKDATTGLYDSQWRIGEWQYIS
jgi:hypothetical protein